MKKRSASNKYQELPKFTAVYIYIASCSLSSDLPLFHHAGECTELTCCIYQLSIQTVVYHSRLYITKKPCLLQRGGQMIFQDALHKLTGTPAI